MRNCFHLALLAAALLIQSTAALGGAPIVYVDASATGANDGTSWANAYTDLQHALSPESTAAPAQLWVAAGVYKPVVPETYGSPTQAERDVSFVPRSGITIYGGFSGGETALEQRNWEANRTVLSGDIANSSSTDANGLVQHPSDLGGGNSFNVVSANSQTHASARLDGVVITGGWAGELSGGCTSSNRSRKNGGGVYNTNGQPVFKNVLIIGNKALCSGGGVYNWDGGRLKFENTAIRFNEAQSTGSSTGGGGLYNTGSGSSINLSHVEIAGNQAGSGGGVYAFSRVDLDNVDISRNSTSSHGGGIYFRGVEMTLMNVTLQGNQSGGDGGAVYFNSSSGQMHFDNVLLAGNQAQRAGGIYRNSNNNNSTMVLRSVAVVSNRASTSGGGIVGASSNVQIDNSIIYANLLGSQYDSPAASLTGTPIARHSLIQNHSPDGPGNFDCAETCPDPRFEDLLDATLAPSASGNFRLRWGSPAIDAGDNARVFMEFDLDGAPRILFGRVDLGPYETSGLMFHDRFERH